MLLGICLAQAGCVRAPSVDIIGSFFPAWMVCVTASVVGAFLVRSVLVRAKLEEEVGPLALFYPSLVVLLACGLWLLFYR
jgi:YtcA family